MSTTRRTLFELNCSLFYPFLARVSAISMPKAILRHENVILFRLKAGHNRIKSHFFNKLKIGDTTLGPCKVANQKTVYICFRTAPCTQISVPTAEGRSHLSRPNSTTAWSSTLRCSLSWYNF